MPVFRLPNAEPLFFFFFFFFLGGVEGGGGGGGWEGVVCVCVFVLFCYCFCRIITPIRWMKTPRELHNTQRLLFLHFYLNYYFYET